jgi:hypothetical protein
MKPLRLYEHFACGYGTIWLLVLLCSFILQTHINTGAFGLFGFPVIALIYAFIRKANEQPYTDELTELKKRVAQLESQN